MNLVQIEGQKFTTNRLLYNNYIHIYRIYNVCYDYNRIIISESYILYIIVH